MSPLETLLTVGSLLVLGRAAPRLLSCTRLWRARLRPPSFRTVPARALPASLDPIFSLADATLGPLGFEPRGARVERPVRADAIERPQRAWLHSETGTLALVGPPRRDTGDRPLQALLVTRRRDGSVLATFDGVEHLRLGRPAEWESEDVDVAGDLRRQWAAHRERLGSEAAAEPLSLEELGALETRAWRGALEGWEREGATGRDDGERAAADAPIWRLRPRGAWRLAGRTLEGRRRLAARAARHARARARLPLWQCDDDRGLPPRDEATRAARIAGMAWRLERVRRGRRSPVCGARRLRELLLVVRLPGAHVALLVVSAVALVAAGWSARSPLAAVLGVALASALPDRWRALRTSRRLRAVLGPHRVDEEPGGTEVALSALEEGPFEGAPAERRIRLADAVLADVEIRARHRTAAAASGAIYVALLVGLPVVALGWLGNRRPPAREATPVRAEAPRTERVGGARVPAEAAAVVLSAPTPLRTVRPGGP